MGRPNQCNVCCGPIVDPDPDPDPDPPISDCGGAICIAFIDENTGNQGGQINITEKVNAWAAAYPDRLLFVLNVGNKDGLQFPPEFSQKDTFFLLRDNGPPANAGGTFDDRIERCNGDTTKGNGNDPWGKIVAMVNFYGLNSPELLTKFNAASEVSIFIDDSSSMNQEDVGQSIVDGEFVYEGTIKRLRDDIIATGREIASSVYNGNEDVFCPFVTANCCPTEGTNDITNLCGLGAPCTIGNISFVKQPTNGLIREYCDDGDPQCNACVDEQTEDEEQTIEYTARISNNNGVSLDYESIDYVLQGSDDNGQTWFDVQSLGSDFSNVEQSLNVLTPDGQCPSFLTATQQYQLVGDRLLGQVFTESEYNTYVASEPADPLYQNEQDGWDVKYAMSEPMSDPTINGGQEFRFLHAAFVYFRYKSTLQPAQATRLKILAGFLKQFRVFNDGTVEQIRPQVLQALSCNGVEYDTTNLLNYSFNPLQFGDNISLSIDCSAKPDPDGFTYNAVAVGFSLNTTSNSSFVNYFLGGLQPQILQVSQDPTTLGYGHLVALSKEEGEYPKKLIVGSASTGISPDNSQLFAYDTDINNSFINIGSEQVVNIIDSSFPGKRLILRSISMSLPIYDDADDRSYYKIAVGCYGVNNISKDHLNIYETPLEDGGSNSISEVTKYDRRTYREYGDNVIIDESASLIHVSELNRINGDVSGRILNYELNGDTLIGIDGIDGPFSELGIWQDRLSQAMSRDSSITKEHIVVSNYQQGGVENRLFSFESINGVFQPKTPVTSISSNSLTPPPVDSVATFIYPMVLDKTGSWGFVETSFWVPTILSSYDTEYFPAPQSFAKSSSDNVCNDFTISQVDANCKRLTYNRLFRIKATSVSDPSFTTNSSTFQLFEWLYEISDDPPPDDPAQGLSGFVKVQSLDERIGAFDSPFDFDDDTGTFRSVDTYSGAPLIPIVPEGELITLASNRTGTIHAVTIEESSGERTVRVYYASATNPDKHHVLGNIVVADATLPGFEPKNPKLFGESLAVSENGRYIFIGCPVNLTTSGSTTVSQGKVLVFKFTQQNPETDFLSGEYLIDSGVSSPSTDKGWGFGYSIDILHASDDEDYDQPFWLAVGDPSTDTSGDSSRGNKVYLFRAVTTSQKWQIVFGSTLSSAEARGKDLFSGWQNGFARFGMVVKIRPQDKIGRAINAPIIAVSAPYGVGELLGYSGGVVFIRFNGSRWQNVLSEINGDIINNQSPAAGDTSNDSKGSLIGTSLCWIKSSDVAGSVNSILVGAPGWSFKGEGNDPTSSSIIGVVVLAEAVVNNPGAWTLTTFWGKDNSERLGFSVAGTFVGVDTNVQHEEIIGWTFFGKRVPAQFSNESTKKNTDNYSFDSRYFDTDRNIWVTYSLGNDLGFGKAFDYNLNRNSVTFSPYTNGTPRFSIAVIGNRELPFVQGIPVETGNLAVYSDEPKALIALPTNFQPSESVGIKLKFAKNEANDNNTQNVRYLRYDRVASNSTYIPARAEGTQTATAVLINDFTFSSSSARFRYTNWYISRNGGELEDTGQSSRNPYTFTYEANDSIILQAAATSFLS